MQSGRSRDIFIQMCVRELFFYCAVYDIELHVLHRPGRTLVRADALSRAHTAERFMDLVRTDPILARAQRVEVPDSFFELDNRL